MSKKLRLTPGKFVRFEHQDWERLERVAQTNPGTMAEHLRWALKIYLDTRFPEANGDTHANTHNGTAQPVTTCHQ